VSHLDILPQGLGATNATESWATEDTETTELDHDALNAVPPKDLDDHLVADDQVDALGANQRSAIVDDDGTFALECDSRLGWLDGEGCRIDALQKSRSSSR
jgi:hypothetical protein